MQLATHPRGAVPQGRISRRSASSRSLEIDPNNEEAYFDARALLPQAAPVARPHQHLRPPHQRRRSTARRRSISTARSRRSTPTRSRTSIARSTRTRTSSISTTRTSRRSKRSRSSTTSRTTPRKSIDYMTRVAELTQDTQAARRDRTTGSARRSTRSSATASHAQERYEMALDLDPSHLPTLAALRQIAIDAADCDKRRALPRSGAELHRRRRGSARGSSSSSASSATRCSASTTSAVLACEARATRADAENEDAAMPLVDEYIAQTRVGEGRAARSRCSSERAASASAASSTRLQNKLGQGAARRSDKDDKALKAYHGGASARSHRPGDDPRPRRGVLPAEGLGRARSRTTRRCSPRSSEDETEERADVYYKLGCIKREQGQAKQAINNFEKALARRRRAPADARGARLALRRSSRTGSRSSPTSGRSSTTSFDGDERFRMLNEIGDIWSDKDKNPPKGHRGARRGARAPAAEPRAPPQAPRSSTRRPRTGRR